MSDSEPQVTQTQAPSTPVTADTALESPTSTVSLSVSSLTNHKQLDPLSDRNDTTDTMPVTDADNGYDVVSNGHLCPNEAMTNGVTTDQSSQGSQSPVQGYTSPDVTTENHNGVRKPHSSANSLPEPSTNHNAAAGVMSSPSTSPNCYSPHTTNSVSPHSGGSPHSNPGGCGPGGSPPHGQQHVVHVHVNPGETFSVRVGDQFQHIQGKTEPPVKGLCKYKNITDSNNKKIGCEWLGQGSTGIITMDYPIIRINLGLIKGPLALSHNIGVFFSD